MSPFVIEQQVDLLRPNAPLVYTQPLVDGDQAAHEWRVRVRQNGRAADLSGMTIRAYVRQDVRLADGSLPPAVMLEGEAAGDTARVTLSADVYGLGGALVAVLRASSAGGETITLAQAYLTGQQLVGGTLIDPSGQLPNIDDLLAQIEAMEAATARADAVATELEDASAFLRTRLGTASFRVDDLSGYAPQQGALSSAGTWNNIGESYQHIVIPVPSPGCTLSIKVSSDSPKSLTYAGVSAYETPVEGASYHATASFGRKMLSPGGKVGQLAVPDDVQFIVLNTVWMGEPVDIEAFALEKLGEPGDLDERWELIQTVTVEEDANAVELTGLNLKNMMIFVESPAAEASMAISIIVEGLFGGMIYASLSPFVQTTARYTSISVNKSGQMTELTVTEPAAKKINAATVKGKAFTQDICGPLYRLYMYASASVAAFIVGTKIDVWGVRA